MFIMPPGRDFKPNGSANIHPRPHRDEPHSRGPQINVMAKGFHRSCRGGRMQGNTTQGGSTVRSLGKRGKRYRVENGTGHHFAAWGNGETGRDTILLACAATGAR
jgi:hypothetical protein